LIVEREVVPAQVVGEQEQLVLAAAQFCALVVRA
jgi:hypothetical protein